MQSRKTQKIWNRLACFFILAGIPLVIWTGYSVASKIVFFWQNGIERQANIKSLERTTVNSKAGISYQYILNIDGRESRQCFYQKLPVGETVSVLTSPNDSSALILGGKKNNIFELFSFYMGSKIMAILAIVMYPFFIYMTPSLLREMFLNRRKWLNP